MSNTLSNATLCFISQLQRLGRDTCASRGGTGCTGECVCWPDMSRKEVGKLDWLTWRFASSRGKLGAIKRAVRKLFAFYYSLTLTLRGLRAEHLQNTCRARAAGEMIVLWLPFSVIQSSAKRFNQDYRLVELRCRLANMEEYALCSNSSHCEFQSRFNFIFNP